MTHALKPLEEEIIACRRCPRLVSWREEISRTKRKAYKDEVYWGKPVPGFGDPDAKIMIIGLAPGAHGSNRTGRMFTGDSSGNFLFPALQRAGFANQSHGDHPADGLELRQVYLTAVCRCVPPKNRPKVAEIKNCLPWLQAEIDLLPNLQGFVTLGRIAFDGLRRLYQTQNIDVPKMDFGHDHFFKLGEGLPWLLTSYHPSQQNTLTGVLTEEMFNAVWTKAKRLIS